MKAEVKMRVTAQYAYIPARIEERFIDPDIEKLDIQAIGNHLQVSSNEGQSSFVARLPLKEWSVGDHWRRKFGKKGRFYIGRWKDNIEIHEDGYIVAEVSSLDGSLEPQVDYYGGDEKITYDEAGEVIDWYLENVGKGVVKAPEIVKRSEVEESVHNVGRVNEVLEERFEVDGSGGGTKRYKVPKKA